MTIAEFTAPRLVAIYDTVNPYAPDTQPRFYRDLAAERRARVIVDVGCGTGLVTCDLARRGYQVTGLDPAPAMVAKARRRQGGDGVHWIDGDVTQLGTPGADLAIMTGHVAQFFVSDDSWHRALATIHGALRPGGALAFESRDPRAQEWTTWTSENRHIVDDPVSGRVETWAEVSSVEDDVVSYATHYRFLATGEEIASPMQLRFRSEPALKTTLTAAGFTVERVYGAWDRRPVDDSTTELIVVASAAPQVGRAGM
jgi:SAM-dependent methyltransferase